jgi:murein DD-endopeptidase MepM/ murein hydrolase activator NlpD
MSRSLIHGLLPVLLGVSALVVPAAAAGESTATAPVSVGEPPVVTTPSTETTVPPPSEATNPETTTTEGPAVTGQVQQKSSEGTKPPQSGSSPQAQTGGEEAGAGVRAPHKAVSPSSLTPGLPLSLQGSISGIPGFFIEDFQIPPFLLPIFEAAGAAYGIPWQVLAAINEVETDYGRDLSVSSAGAEGWMQFLPSSWAEYAVDANGDGYKDPYNPADAIFTAARYLRAAGGDSDIRGAIYAYNHSQAYVSSVMLRAQLLGGTPSELLGAITGLTEARFPVHAAAHFADGFPAVRSGSSSKTLVGTAIYAAAGAPVIAVQDGEVTQIGQSPSLGKYVMLRDAYGNTYVYAGLGDVSSVYPVLEPKVNSTVTPQIDSEAHEPAPSGPATAGVQPRSPLSEGATVSGLALGAAAGLESAPATPTTPSPSATQPQTNTPKPVAPHVEAFSEGANEVYLHQLQPGVQVIAGTVLGHVGDGSEAGAGEGEPHIVFQIKPAGPDAPLIDPKPILDGWVALENSSVFHAKGENPFLATSPTVGQVLLESQQQLEPQVLRDAGIHLSRCGREDVREGRVDKRVLAALEYLSVSGLKPTVAGLPCAPATPAALAANVTPAASSTSIEITAVNGVPVEGHQTQGSVADTAVRKLLMLQGLSRPRRILSTMSYPGANGALTSSTAQDAIRVSFASPQSGLARVAGLYASALAPAQWTRLIARLGEIPDPSVSGKPSSAAILDKPNTSESGQDGDR